ncbi:hypothetical protein Sjap_021075 [Stephania japonica]|uniref:Protein kinase domain-containing protein n=1 Tax=Stephania japonica TaxID=461633 RepID=A0AAP0F1X7_9MAGN
MEGAAEEAIEVVEGGILKGKDGDSRVGTNGNGNGNMMIESGSVFVAARDWPLSMSRGFGDGLEGEGGNGVVGLEQASGNNEDGGDMVEELILGNYRDSNSNSGIRQGQNQQFYPMLSGSGNGNSRLEALSKDKAPVSVGGEMRNTFLSHIWTQKPPIDKSLIGNNSNNSVAVRTKHLSSSGFSQFFIKNSLKGKGIVRRDLEAPNRLVVASDAPLSLAAKEENVALASPNPLPDGINLREWLRPGRQKVSRSESLHMFQQIVELVDLAHSQEVALQGLRPSCFILLPSNQVKYMGSVAEMELLESAKDDNVSLTTQHLSRKRLCKEVPHPGNSIIPKHRKLSQNMPSSGKHVQFSSQIVYDHEPVKFRDTRIQMPQSKSGSREMLNVSNSLFLHANSQLEEKWYTSPEELNERGPSFSSNVYALGVLLFELFCCFESWEVHAATMLDLRHRILPPNFLSEYPKEAGFCLWLLHPEPSSRPSTREILQSEFMCELREIQQGVSSEDQSSSSIDEDYAESELLLHFLLSMKEQKQKQASKLVEFIGCLEADTLEVEKRQTEKSGMLCRARDSSYARELGSHNKEPFHSERILPTPSMSKTSIQRNINQLENAYFSTRCQISPPESGTTIRSDRDLLKNRESLFPVQNQSDGQALSQPTTDLVGMFFDGLCKYARYSKFEVRGILRNGDLHNSANVICSLSFDKDEEYFAAAGVSKKIKIFEFRELLNDSVDIHYPVIEMSSRSKLSCVCWNGYIKNYLASTDYDGIVQLWDASTGQGFSQYTDHERRAWSVDFSPVDPTKLASGSDDCSKKCIGTVRNVANVCCVQFSSHSTHLLAFGSADYQTYCYDLRNTRSPWCKLAGHGKAVSYVKFLDHETLISASTDNTLKLWDLNKTSSSGLSTNTCSLTFKGHTNEKNFVGLSVSDGYITCGSETNEIYAYYRSLPMPITAHKFGSIDPISGQETSEAGGQFVSSVCWKGKSDMVVTANSSGSIKVLQMV